MQGLTAVVAGATGGTGRAVVSRLLAEGVPTTAIVRNPADAVSSEPPGAPFLLSPWVPHSSLEHGLTSVAESMGQQCSPAKFLLHASSHANSGSRPVLHGRASAQTENPAPSLSTYECFLNAISSDCLRGRFLWFQWDTRLYHAWDVQQVCLA